MTATVSLRQTKRSGVSHARLQSRHPAPTSQSRFSSTKAKIRKVVDLDESFHTHRQDAITGAKKKKPRLERFLHHQEANHCLLWRSRARRATQGSSTAQVVVVQSDPRARQASTSQSKNYSWKNLVDDEPASLLCLWYQCGLAVCIWHDKVKSVQRTDDPADRGPHQSPFSDSNVIFPEKWFVPAKRRGVLLTFEVWKSVAKFCRGNQNHALAVETKELAYLVFDTDIELVDFIAQVPVVCLFVCLFVYLRWEAQQTKQSTWRGPTRKGRKRKERKEEK